MKRPGRKNVNNVEDKVAFRICNPAKSMAYLSDAEKGDNLKKKLSKSKVHTAEHTALSEEKLIFGKLRAVLD